MHIKMITPWNFTKDIEEQHCQAPLDPTQKFNYNNKDFKNEA